MHYNFTFSPLLFMFTIFLILHYVISNSHILPIFIEINVNFLVFFFFPRLCLYVSHIFIKGTPTISWKSLSNGYLVWGPLTYSVNIWWNQRISFHQFISYIVFICMSHIYQQDTCPLWSLIRGPLLWGVIVIRWSYNDIDLSFSFYK